jgi:GLPGLI family protein
MYLGYECQKAFIENEDEFIVAWFTPQIPVQTGPAGLHGLPGLILMANYNDGEVEIKAQEIDLRPLAEGEIIIPDDGKKVTEEEFHSIREAKEKEMDEMYGGRNVKRIGR